MPDSLTPKGATAPYGTDHEAEVNWLRYEYVKNRGHREYTYRAQRSENFWFGGDTTNPRGYKGDGQWLESDADELRDAGRPSYTVNEIKPGINSAIGYQIHNRLDLSYKPAGGMADMEKAVVRSKLAMQVLSQNKFHWLETQVFGDGLIQQRGYFDIRMNFDTNVFGDIQMNTEDPLDVAPDPDAKTYNPNGWGDVIVTRWYTLDEIEQHYGKEARTKAEQYKETDGDWGEQDDTAKRNKFGDPEGHFLDWYRDGVDGHRRYRIIDRQRWVYEMCRVAVYLDSGEIKPIPHATPEQIAGYVKAGAVTQRRMQKQVRWTVTTRWCTLHDAISPYDRFTIIPYFCYFRRGRTGGKVDDAIDPQQILNKSISSFVHIVNTTANSGWISEQGSLVNMKNEDLTEKGSMTGLNLVVKPGSQYPVKIQPNQAPQGIDRLIDHAYMAIKNATTPDAMRGTQGQEISGVAIQSRQFASQQELALPLDNLTHTREMVADFVTYLIERFYTNFRIFRVTETDPRTGKEADQEYRVNEYDPATGAFINDLTEGEYDVVVDSVPMQVTFENSQFQQSMEIKKVVPTLPDRFIIKNSNLADKAQIIEAMDAMSQGNPVDEAKALLAQAQAAKVRMETLLAGIQGATQLAASPAIGPAADEMAKSSGFQDQNQQPAVPSVAATPAPAIPSAPPMDGGAQQQPQGAMA